MSAESDWMANKAKVAAYMKELIDLGFTLETARSLARWNPTYEYDNYSDLQYPASVTATPGAGFSRDLLRLKVTRSSARVNADLLDGAVIDAGKLYAIFIEDVPELGINYITFKLDGVNVHTEFSTPWDYAGTAGGGDANRVVFVAGSHIIEAEINDDFGNHTLEASFEVE